MILATGYRATARQLFPPELQVGGKWEVDLRPTWRGRTVAPHPKRITLPAFAVPHITHTLPTTPHPLQAAAGYSGDDQWLYRAVLAPELPNVAFVGQNATFQAVLTTALQVKGGRGVKWGSSRSAKRLPAGWCGHLTDPSLPASASASACPPCLQSRWLVDSLRGDLELPPIGTQLEDIDKQKVGEGGGAWVTGAKPTGGSPQTAAAFDCC